MDPTPLATVASWSGGRLSAGRHDANATTICTDSRALRPGDLFVAIRGEKFDGHDFVARAAQLGAIGAVVEKSAPGLPPDFAVVEVADTVKALQTMAGAYRTTLPLKAACITGSNGKTSTKDLTASVLARRFAVTRTEGNLNNHIGLPLTILRANSRHGAGVFEIGMNHPGEIAPLAAIARPDLAIITNIGVAHIEFMGTREAIALEKGALAEAVGDGGTVILNADDEFTPSIAKRTRAHVMTAGLQGGDVRATDLEQLSEGIRFRLHATGRWVEAGLPVPGEHMVRNALLGCAAGIVLGVTLEECAHGLRDLQLTTGRLTQKTVAGIHLIDDTYNANPDSMSAALVTLAHLPVSGRRIAVLGRMAELGSHSEWGHRRVGEVVGREGIPYLVTVGDEARWIADAATANGVPNVLHTDNVEDATRTLRELARSGDAVLIKGSRSARLERIVQAMEGGSH